MQQVFMEVQTSRLYFKYINKFQFFIGYNFDTTGRTSIKKTILKTVTAKYKPGSYLVWTLLLFIKGMQVN